MLNFYFFNLFFCKFFFYYFSGSFAELKSSGEAREGSNKDKVLSTYYGSNFKYIASFFLIFFSIFFQTLIEYDSTETLLFSSFILVFLIIIFIITDGFLSLKGDFFFNILDAFAFSYKLRSLKISRLRLNYSYNNLNLFYKLNCYVFILDFFKKFNLNKDFLFEENAFIFHNFFFFD